MLRPPFRIALLVVAGAVLFYLAVSPSVYEATSPAFLSWHVLLRKIYSIGAFALLALIARWAVGVPRFWPYVVGTALYSAAIEVGQFFMGSHEGLGWNTVDVACGALGGALAWIAVRATSRVGRDTMGS